MAGVTLWSQTAATNANVDSTVNWAENQAPSTVNNSARAMMAAIAKWRDDISGNLVTGGSSIAYTATTSQSFSPLVDGYSLTLRMSVTNGAASQLNVDATGLKDIRTNTSTAVPEGALLAGSVHRFTYDSGDNCWYVSGFFAVTTLAGGSLNIIGTTELTAPAIDDVALVYDLSATANRRITLLNLLNVVAALTAETSVAVDDSMLLYDLSEAAVNKTTPVSFLNILNILTEDTAPDSANDFFLSYDASASTVKKVKVANAGFITPMVAQATTSGTTFDFTGIPVATKRITVILDQVSLSGTNDLLVQIGDSGGLETSGYLSCALLDASGGGSIKEASTSGFVVAASNATRTVSAVMSIVRSTGNSWVASVTGMANLGGSPESAITGGGTKTLSADLDRVRLLAHSSNTFDSGAVNVFYE